MYYVWRSLYGLVPDWKYGYEISCLANWINFVKAADKVTKPAREAAEQIIQENELKSEDVPPPLNLIIIHYLFTLWQTSKQQQYI